MRPFLWLYLLVAALSVATAVERPNLIVVNMDDLGYADIGPFGSKLNRTPNLDRMAAEGCRLTSFYAAPVCSPSRAALMTGCYPKRVLPIPHVLFPNGTHGLHSGERTIAELLKQAGYATACIGKWHLGDQPEFLPRRRGFDYYLGTPYSNDMGPAADGTKSNLGEPLPKENAKGGQPPLPLVENETVIARIGPDEQQGIVKRYTEASVAFIQANRDKPFFLYLAHNAVHFPLYPGKAFLGKSSNGMYGDWVEESDWSIGQVLETLRGLKLDAQTVVLFTSDNGGTPKGVNTPLRGFKASTWEGGMRVPTIVWAPGRIPASTSLDAITGMMDVMPTFVKLAGGELPTDRKIDGGDIWPLLVGREGAKAPRETFYFFRGLDLEAVRSGDWKLHLKGGALYNLREDIGESRNVAAENAEVVQRLMGLVALMKDDLGIDKIFGPGVRALGRVDNPQPLIDHSGKIRAGFEPEGK
jgi:arylsulfatase A